MARSTAHCAKLATVCLSILLCYQLATGPLSPCGWFYLILVEFTLLSLLQPMSFQAIAVAYGVTLVVLFVEVEILSNSLFVPYGIRIAPWTLLVVFVTISIGSSLSKFETITGFARKLCLGAMLCAGLFLNPLILQNRPVLGTPTFSAVPGFHTSPQRIHIRPKSTGDRIVFTVDGRDPTRTGNVFRDMIQFESTTVIRAAAMRFGFQPSAIVSASFIFPGQLDQQGKQLNPTDYPTTWRDFKGRLHKGDYSIDTQLTENVDVGECLQSIPSVSLSLDPKGLFDTDGLYQNAMKKGKKWEVPASFELICSNDQPIHASCGVRIHGGLCRSLEVTRKLSFRVYFRDEPLSSTMFDGSVASKSHVVVLRGGSVDSWAMQGNAPTAQFIRDEFVRRTQLAMGHPALRGEFVHLFINGLYWGVYNFVERPDSHLVAERFGVPKKHCSLIKDGKLKCGNWDSWIRFDEAAVAVAQKKAPLESLNEYVDLANYVDYLLLNFYCGVIDWPQKNYVAFDRQNEVPGFRFLVWDAEWSLDVGDRTDGFTWKKARSGVALPFSRLLRNTEFQIYFSDRVQMHCVEPTGVFYCHPDRALASNSAVRYREIANSVRSSLHLESSRWGDQCSNEPFTVSDWDAEFEYLMTEFFPHRTELLLKSFRHAWLFADAPRATLVKKDNRNLLKLYGKSDIFFTTDGSDPSRPDGSVSQGATKYIRPIPVEDLTRLKARSLVDGRWSACKEFDPLH